MERTDERRPAGPTLYLEAGRPAAAAGFCAEVLAGDGGGEYRVVQLTTSRRFDSLREALDAQLADVHDPSAAAVIMATPGADDDPAVTTVGAETPLYGFRVDPQDLTGISVAFSRLLEQWEETEGPVRICLRDVESLLPYHDAELLYRFLNTVLATLQGAGADVHVHLRPATTDDRTLELFESLFDRVVDRTAGVAAEPVEEPGDEGGSSAAPGVDGAATAGPAASGSSSVTAASMSEEAVDSFLASAGHGVLAFDGESPYALPMSFAYDPDRRTAYVHLSTFEDSEKARRLRASTAVTLVVSRYRGPDRWQSAVVEGSLTRLPHDAARERGVPDLFADSDLASVDVFCRDLSAVSFEWYALEPSATSGRQGARSP